MVHIQGLQSNDILNFSARIHTYAGFTHCWRQTLALTFSSKTGCFIQMVFAPRAFFFIHSEFSSTKFLQRSILLEKFVWGRFICNWLSELLLWFALFLIWRIYRMRRNAIEWVHFEWCKVLCMERCERECIGWCVEWAYGEVCDRASRGTH